MTEHLDRFGDVTARCRAELLARARQVRAGSVFLDEFPSYFAKLEDNFVPGITPELYVSNYGGGAGAELGWRQRGSRRTPPKMQAVHSSSALVVNSFGPWKRHVSDLPLAEYRGFRSLRFEATMPTGLGGIPPHLDALAEALNGPIVGIESKATEYLGPHTAHFASSYAAARWPPCVAEYVNAMERLIATPNLFRYLDAAQLIKHAFGLGVQYPERAVTLLYAFWEPLNADEYSAFREHRSEVSQFANLVAGSSVRFAWITYRDLWRAWSIERCDWLRIHVQHLLERYSLEV